MPKHAQKPDFAITYTQNGRGGQVIYTEGKSILSFEWEFGGADTLAIIFIPKEPYWEKLTGTPASRRSDILRNIGAQVVKDQAPSGRFVIEDDAILIVR